MMRYLLLFLALILFCQPTFSSNCVARKLVLENMENKEKYLIDSSDFVFIGKPAYLSETKEFFPDGDQSVLNQVVDFDVIELIKKPENDNRVYLRALYDRSDCSCILNVEFEKMYKMYASYAPDNPDGLRSLKIYFCEEGIRAVDGLIAPENE